MDKHDRKFVVMANRILNILESICKLDEYVTVLRFLEVREA